MNAELALILIVLLVPFGLYGAARIISIAYFKTKREHTRQVLNEIDPGPCGQNKGD